MLLLDQAEGEVDQEFHNGHRFVNGKQTSDSHEASFPVYSHPESHLEHRRSGIGVVGLFGGRVEVNDTVATPTQQIGRLAITAGTPMFKG